MVAVVQITVLLSYHNSSLGKAVEYIFIFPISFEGVLFCLIHVHRSIILHQLSWDPHVISIIPALETRSHRGVPVEEDPKSYDAAVVQVSILV